MKKVDVVVVWPIILLFLILSSCKSSRYIEEGTYYLNSYTPFLYYDSYEFLDGKGHRIVIKSNEYEKYYWTDSIIISRKINK